MERWQPGYESDKWIVGAGGEDIFVLKGDFTFTSADPTASDDENDHSRFAVKTDGGCQLFIKSHHLAMNLDSINIDARDSTRE